MFTSLPLSARDSLSSNRISIAKTLINNRHFWNSSLTNRLSYFNEYALKRLYFPDPKHSKYINRDVLKRYMPVGGIRIEDDILISHDGWEMLTTTPKGEEALKIIRGDQRHGGSH